MASTMSNPSVESSAGVERYHVFHAEAHVLSGHLEHPIKQPIEHHGRVLLEKTRREEHISTAVAAANLEGLISFKGGHTRVSGSQLKDKKDIWGNDHSGWVTLSTSVIEGLNVSEVITADRLVAQIATEHPLIDGHVPKVTFLGTRFENLRVAGYPVQLELDFGICGNKPQGDLPYLEDSGFLDRVEGQVNSVAHAKGLPEVLEKQYDAKIADIDELKKRAKRGSNGGRNGDSKLQCSLVKSIAPIPIPGVKTFGNIIFIPDFGIVSLAEVDVGISAVAGGFLDNSGNGSSRVPNGASYFTLHMLNMRLGCPLVGTSTAASTTVNGQTRP